MSSTTAVVWGFVGGDGKRGKMAVVLCVCIYACRVCICAGHGLWKRGCVVREGNGGDWWFRGGRRIPASMTLVMFVSVS